MKVVCSTCDKEFGGEIDLKVMGKCAGQVYFVEKWSKRQALKFSIS